MKKLSMLIICLSAVLSLSACGKNNSASVETTDAPTDISSSQETDTAYQKYLAQLTITENKVAKEEEVMSETDITQADLNTAAENKYKAWDDLLNYQWALLKEELDAETMSTLTTEQLKWINDKEEAAKEAAEHVEGGSMYPLEFYSCQAKWTEERVLELEKYLEQLD